MSSVGDDADALADAVHRAAEAPVGGRAVQGGEQRRQVLADLFVQVTLKPGAEAFALGAVEELAADDFDPGTEGGAAGADAGDRLAVPGDGVVGGEGEGVVRRGFRGSDAAGDFLAQRAAGGAHDQLAFLAGGGGVGEEGEAGDEADLVAFDHDLAAAGDGGEEILAVVGFQPAHQVGGAAVDEAGGEAFVQGVGEQVLDLAGTGLQVGGVADPVGPGGDVGPDADAGEALHQGVEVAVGRARAAMLPAIQSVGRVWPRTMWRRPGRRGGCGFRRRACGSRGSGRRPTGCGRPGGLGRASGCRGRGRGPGG